jgi:alpha-maltose-1-phosphate synthase
MRIALVYLGRRGSGGPISLELATRLGQHAEVMAFISTFAENAARWRSSGLNLRETPTYRNHVEAAWTWMFPGRIHALAEQIRQFQPAVMLFPMFHTWNPFLQSRLREVPSIVTVHDPTPHPGDVDWVFENRSVQQAKRCILLSEGLQPDLVARGVSPDAIDIIPHGELSYYRTIGKASEPGNALDQPVILFFGRITLYKGLNVLLQAFELLRQERRALLRIVGSGNLKPYAHLLERLPDVEVINHWIPDEQVAGYFENASVVVLPYTTATQSGVLGIAASFGTPVVATMTGGLPEQIVHEQTGLLVEPGSPEGLCAALEQLLDDPASARQLGNNLRQAWQARHNWDLIADLTIKACQRALEPH